MPSLKLSNLFRRGTASSLRERAAEMQARIPAGIKPDPVLPVIEEGRRLLAASREAFKLPNVGLDPHPSREAAQDAVWAHFRGPISSAMPTTARGCTELARYATAFCEFQDVEIGGELAEILANIARSPTLNARAQAEPAQARYSIADRVDVASASMTELRTIHEKMRHLSDLAYAMASQGCCRSGDRSPFGNPHNAAGELMHRIGDELTAVESRAAEELHRRRPTNLDDRATRLAAIATQIICNGDDAEIAAFMQELTAWATERAGI